MQLGIFAKTFSGTDPLSVLTAVRDCGFTCAQYNMACSGLAPMPDDISQTVIQDIVKATAKTGVKLSAISGTFNMIHPDVSIRNQGLSRLAMLASNCANMGASLITLCTGTRDPDDQWRDHPDNQSNEAWSDLRTSCERAVAIAEQYNVLLGIEPELANVVNSATKAKRLITELQSPRIKVILDAANLFENVTLNEQREIITHAIGELGEHIIMAHAKDRKPTGQFATAGTGCLDYQHYLKSLKSAGFNGALITHGLKAEEATGIAQFLKSAAHEAGFTLT
jgi:sugar phosphate isomerase/epimerase